MLTLTLRGRTPAAGAAAASDRPRKFSSRWRRPKNWDRHVGDLEQMAESPGFKAIRDRILELAQLRSSDRLLDIGAGTGLLALAAASRVTSVSALDVSPAMCRHLDGKFRSLGIPNADILLSTATDIPLQDGSIDVVLSNYCLHHLSNAEKRRALMEMRRVLRPGGRLVFGDMMFRLSISTGRDRAVIALLVSRLIRRGPAGLARLLKNGMRIAVGRWEHPASVDWWRDALLQAGFVEVAVHALEHEGGIATARCPG